MSENAAQYTDRHVLYRMCDGDFSWFEGMHELMVASPDVLSDPTILLKSLYYFSLCMDWEPHAYVSKMRDGMRYRGNIEGEARRTVDWTI